MPLKGGPELSQTCTPIVQIHMLERMGQVIALRRSQDSQQCSRVSPHRISQYKRCHVV